VWYLSGDEYMPCAKTNRKEWNYLLSIIHKRRRNLWYVYDKRIGATGSEFVTGANRSLTFAGAYLYKEVPVGAHFRLL